MINRHILDNLLRYPEPAARVCTVIRPLGASRYQLRDSAGRVITAEDSTGRTWQNGDGVTVYSGRIVRAAGKISTPKVYEVL